MALASAKGLALIRIAFGVYFVVSAFKKTMDGWLTSADGLTGFVQRNLDGAAPLYASFLDTIVLPHAPTFAQLVVLGEWVAGLTLLLGLFTRLGGIVGAWLVLNYMVAKGLPNAEGSNDRLFFVACLALAFAASGIAWGLDGAWRPSLESNPLTRWLSGLPAPRTQRLEALTERRRPARRVA